MNASNILVDMTQRNVKRSIEAKRTSYIEQVKSYIITRFLSLFSAARGLDMSFQTQDHLEMKTNQNLNTDN